MLHKLAKCHYQKSNMQNIILLEQVFNKGKNKNTAGLPKSVL